MFISSRRERPDPHLEKRVYIFWTGAILGLAGIFMDVGWLVGVAIAVLAVGMVLRFVSSRKNVGGPSDPEAESSEDVS